jgi:hypothetical protein
MLEVTTDFRSLPQEYQQVLQQAQEMYQITIAPLELLVGGWSGTVVYPVSVAERVLEANQEILRSALSEGELAAAQEKGRGMSLEQALAFASEGP